MSLGRAWVRRPGCWMKGSLSECPAGEHGTQMDFASPDADPTALSDLYGPVVHRVFRWVGLTEWPWRRCIHLAGV